MNPAQQRIVGRFRRLVLDARGEDLILAVDANAWALRFIPREKTELVMTIRQARVVARFRRLVRDAHDAGLFLVVDAHAWALRFILRENEHTAVDLGLEGEAVPFRDEPCDLTEGEAVVVDSACGTPATSSHPVMGSGRV